MEASDDELGVLHPANREYIRVQFDEGGKRAVKLPSSTDVVCFNINVREALSTVFAVLVWGAQWQGMNRSGNQPLHVRCWIDNTLAVVWIGRHNSSNILAQELTRVLSFAELQFNLHVTTSGVIELFWRPSDQEHGQDRHRRIA